MSPSLGMKHLSWPYGLFLLAIMLSSCSKPPPTKSPKIHELLGIEFKLSVKEAQTLHEDAEDLYRDGKYLEGFRCLDEALRITEKSSQPSPRDLANIFTTIAEGRMVLGQMDKVSDLLMRSLAIAESALGTNDPVVGRILRNQALMRLLQGSISEPPALLTRCVAIQKASRRSDDASLALILQVETLLRFSEGRHSEAIESINLSSAIILKEFGSENVVYAQNLNLLAMVQWKLADYAQAEVSCTRGLSVLTNVLGPDHPIMSQGLNTLGLVYQGQERYADALVVLKRNLRILEKTLGPDHLHVALNLKIMGLVCYNMGKYDEAQSCLQRNRLIYEKIMGPVSAPTATTLNNLGLVEAARGNPGVAGEYFARCLDIMTKVAGRDHPEVANAMHNLAAMHYRQGDVEKALPFYQESLELSIKAYGIEHPKVAASLEHLAFLLMDVGEIETSIRCLVTMFNVQRPYLAGQFVATPSKDALRVIERSFPATEFFHSACGTTTAPVAVVISGAEQLALSKSFLEEVHAMQSALEADPETATRTLREKYRSLQERIARLPEIILESGQRDSHRRALQEELTGLEERLGDQDRMVARTVRERALTLEAVAQNLPWDAVLVDLVHYRRFDIAATNPWKEARYAAYLTFPLAKDSTNVIVERVDLGEAAPINEAIERILNQLAIKQRDSKILKAELQRLSQSLYTPLARHLTNVLHLIICPDGQVSRLPFEMLLVSGLNEPAKYLAEEKTVSYVGSGREVARLAQPPFRTKTTSPLVMGDPDFNLDIGSSRPGIFTMESLEYFEKEARSVAGLLGKDCRLRLGKEARESELKVVVSPQVLYLATHAQFQSDQVLKRLDPFFDDWKAGKIELPHQSDWENPMLRCFIALAGVNHALRVTDLPTEDGLLTALEASLLNLQGTELVILSACETGAGEVKIGEGVTSLRRAFRVAGAEAVLASHWSVDDEATSRMMAEFMRRWRAGEPRAKAWREAQLALLRSKGSTQDFSNPYFWAAFTLTGQWR